MRITAIKRVVPVLLLLCLAQIASAFYDPSFGRWINRDPIQESGGGNLYAFARNNAIVHKDAFGWQIVPIPFPAMPPSIKLNPNQIGGAYQCRDMIMRSMWSAHHWANDNFGLPGAWHSNAGSVADMLTHCVGACEVSKNKGQCNKCGLDAEGIIMDREDGGSVDSRIDILNNLAGFVVADAAADCKQGCLDLLNNGLLWTHQNNQIVNNQTRR